MRVPPLPKPINRTSFSTVWSEGTVPATLGQSWSAVLLFLICAAATMTIAVRSPLVAWGYALLAIAGASVWATVPLAPGNAPASVRDVAFLGIAACGAVQLLSGASVYRYATLDAWTRTVGLVATVYLARAVLATSAVRMTFLRAFVKFAAVVSAAAVLTYFTSPGKILWVFPSPYPDTWGPFLSRNDFAAFLELAFPVALWLGLAAPRSRRELEKQRRKNTAHSSLVRDGDSSYLFIAAWLLAAGLASASRAGSALLAAEALLILTTFGARRSAIKFGVVSVLLIAVVGVSTLLHRWEDSDPLQFRREIQQSAVEMIRERPLAGFGLGTFVRVYPAHARFDLGALVDHAHNDWLEWAAEGGLPYALAWVVVAASIARPAARSIWGWGVIAIFLHAFVDYPFARFGVSAWTMTLIGALCADDKREVSVRRH
jgi:O-antigen ligase